MTARQRETPYLDALCEYADRDPARLHVPGHKGGLGADEGLLRAIGERALRLDIPALTYGIDLMRHPLLRGLYPGNLGTDYLVSFDIMVLALFAVVMLALAALLFGEEEHLGRILLVEPPRKKGPKPSRVKRLVGRGEKSGEAPAPAPAPAAASGPAPAAPFSEASPVD